MNKPILAANWKMNLGPSASLELGTTIAEKAASCADAVEVWLTPSFAGLAALVELASSSSIKLGAQNVHWEETGAFTGEVSVAMLRELGCSYALSGHSERRHVFGETNELVIKRSHSALKQGFTVLHCIGEKLEQREAGTTNEVLKEQLDPLLKELSNTEIANLVIAYEPVWAIGTGKVASIEEITETHSAIQDLCQPYTDQIPPICYGGSVNPDNFKNIIAIESVSGALVGGASLSLEKFSALIDIASA